MDLGLGLPELIVILVIFGIPAGIVAFIMILAKSRQRRQLRRNNGMLLTYCTKCGEEVMQGSSSCQHCGEELPNVHDAPKIPAASSIITNDDYARFVGIKAEKYLPKFKKFSVHEIDSFKATWHWPAFFVPFWWMLYRKLYGWAILSFFGIIPYTGLFLSVVWATTAFGIIPYIGLFLNVVWAITANYIYYKHAKKKLLEIKQLHPSPETQRALSAAAGGVGDAWLLIGVPIGFIAIIVILAVIAIPMSRMQTVKAKLSEVTNIMCHVQSAEVAAKLDLGGYIYCMDASEIQSKLGLRFDTRYITKINVIEGIITATIRNTNSDADGKTLTLSPDATGEVWTWGGTAPTKYKPRK